MDYYVCVQKLFFYIIYSMRLNLRCKLLRDANAIDAMRNNRYSVASLLTASLSMTRFNIN